jgi:hypothetical protein
LVVLCAKRNKPLVSRYYLNCGFFAVPNMKTPKKTAPGNRGRWLFVITDTSVGRCWMRLYGCVCVYGLGSGCKPD